MVRMTGYQASRDALTAHLKGRGIVIENTGYEGPELTAAMTKEQVLAIAQLAEVEIITAAMTYAIISEDRAVALAAAPVREAALTANTNSLAAADDAAIPNNKASRNPLVLVAGGLGAAMAALAAVRRFNRVKTR